MAEEKKGFSLNFEDAGELNATRARNKTMMLSPEVTNRFRSQVLEELDQGQNQEERTRRINLSKSSFLRPSATVDDSPKQDTGNNQRIGLASGFGVERETKPLESEEPVIAPEFARPAESGKSFDDTSRANFQPVFTDLQSTDNAINKEPMVNPRPEPRQDYKPTGFGEPEFGSHPHASELPTQNRKGIFDESKEIEPASAKRSTTQHEIETNDGSSVKLVYPGKKGKLRGFLISYHFNPEGDHWPLYEGRIIVTSKFDKDKKDANYLVIEDETVDSFHAIMRVSEGKLMVLDQLSETGTRVIRSDGEILELNGDKAELGYKEKIKFGDVEFIALLI